MVDEKPVSVRQQTGLMFIPIIFVWIWLFYRIKRVKRGILPMVAGYGSAIGMQMILPFPYGIIFTIGVAPLIPVFFIRKWTREWNEKFSSSKSDM